MQKLKCTIITVAVIVILVMMTATFIENTQGTEYTNKNIYGSWWFVILWILLACTSLAYIIKRQLFHRWSVMTIHIAFLVILAGAFTSWLTSKSGTLHIRKDASSVTFQNDKGGNEQLGFNVNLENFQVINYPGTDAAMDYETILSTGNEKIKISMNHIGEYQGFRFTQVSYDDDMNGTTLGILYDPWGIAITYLGYVMLFISLIISIFGKSTRIRYCYRKAMGKMGIILLIMVSGIYCPKASAQNKLEIDSKIYNDFGRICVLYNNRICPINTVATDFTMKLCGSSSWKGMTANEVFAGWIFDVPYWETEKMIKVKDKKVQEILGINDKWASFQDFWNEYNEYKLEKPLKEANTNGNQKLQKELRAADEKYNIIRMLYNGELLKMYPYKNKDGNYDWIAPGNSLKDVRLAEKELRFVMKSMDYLAESIITKDSKRAQSLTDKIYKYQHIRGKEVIPSDFIVKCELFYNTLNATHWPIFVYITLSLVMVIAFTMIKDDKKQKKIARVNLLLILVMLIHTSLLLGLRWLVSGHLPLSNGYETLQFLAWAVMLIAILSYRKIEIVKNFCPLLASFALLAAMITDSNPQITQLMPVLQSPLLSIHVMVIMFSYALLGLTMLVGLEGLVAHNKKQNDKEEQLAYLSLFILYPATALLAIGIFIGAIWANVSWGKYWSWDSKEVWALITLLIYAAPLHSDIKWLRKPLNIHIYMVVAFLSVLMTYFGVNYFLTGMHSYA